MLPPESALERVRDAYRAEDAVESARETQLQFSSWRDTAALMWGDLAAGLLALHEAPTALRVEGV